MSSNVTGIAHLGELLAMIDRHAVPEERELPSGGSATVRVPKPLDRWKPAKAARFKRLERLQRKLAVGSTKPLEVDRRKVQDGYDALVERGVLISARTYIEQGRVHVEYAPVMPAEHIAITAVVGEVQA